MTATVRELSSGQSHELGDVALIGRGDGVRIRLDDSSVSRQHAAIRLEEARFWLVDLGSVNGTFVNGVALTAARVLRSGDRLQVGKSFLVFEDGGSLSAVSDRQSDRTQISLSSPEPLRSVPVTIMVADLRGFTAICEVLSAGQVADLLREWYADCESILKGQGASIDKFIGDCVFAYWYGMEADIRTQAYAAAEALRAIEVRPTSPTRMLLASMLGETLDCRIGLHVGRVSVGTMGKNISTALGDAVNMAFRIEGLTRVVHKPIVVSGAFLEDWPEGRRRFESCGLYPVKGYKENVEIFAPIGS